MTDREYELLAEVQELRGRLAVAERQLERLDDDIIRLQEENAELTRARGLNKKATAAWAT